MSTEDKKIEKEIKYIDLLKELNGQTKALLTLTAELKIRNDRLSSLTKWLIFMTGFLSILTIILTYFIALSVGIVL